MFELPKLPYDYSALEPHIDEQTMRIHHGKHHAGYVEKLNAALQGFKQNPPGSIENILRNLKDLPLDIQTAVRNNGGGHANHSIFWQSMSPKGGGTPEGKLKIAIESAFGGFETLKEKFTEAALSRFGSGWVWLSLDDGKLVIESTANQDSPFIESRTPILGLDLWEHAYYLKYQNRRGDYVNAWWNVVNWSKAEEQFLGIRK